jgi:uncharacterized protein (DUF1330 family)
MTSPNHRANRQGRLDVTVYAVAQISIHDRRRYQRYASRFMGVLAGSDGKLLAADSSPQILSGEWPHDKLVLLQFPNRTQFERWARSPEYVEISDDRIAATTGSVVLVTGVGSPATIRPDHADLAERLAAHGPAAVQTELRHFLREARRRNASPVLVEVLADPGQPEVARQRAFGKLHAELEQPPSIGRPDVPGNHDAA